MYPFDQARKSVFNSSQIPLELQSHYGRAEIVKALGTSDRREAEQLCRVAGAKLDEEFSNVRAALAAGAHPSGTVAACAPSAAPTTSAPTQDTPATAPAPDAPIRINADEVASSTLGLLRQRRDAAATQGYDALTAFLERQQFNLEDNEAILRGELEALHPLSKHEGWRNGLRAFLTGDGSVKELQEHIAPAQPLQAVSLAQPVRPVSPSPSAQTTNPPYGQPPQLATIQGHTLEQIADKWVRERAPIKRTVGQAQKVIGRYVEHMGNTKVEQITRRHVVEFKDKLLESGQTPVNTNKQLMILSIPLNFAVANSIIEQNPSKGIKVEVRKNAKEARLPFDVPALRALFSSPVYSLGERPKGGAGEAGYWLPLLALFTGARIEELCQLHPDDVYQETYRELDGSERSAWVLRITDEGPGQALKCKYVELQKTAI